MSEKSKRAVKESLLIVVVCFISAAGTHFFKFPNHFTTGGVTGLAIVLHAWFPMMSQGFISNVLNIALMVVGMLLLGRAFGAKTALYTVAFTLSLMFYEAVAPISKPLTDEPLLELVLAVVLPSAAGALVFNIGASTGGTDIIAMLLKKYAHVYNTSTALLMADIAIGAMAFFVFDFKTGIFSVFGLLMRSFMTEAVLTSINQRKYFHIITPEPAPIQEYITKVLHRSATLFEGEGAYTGEKRMMILTVVSPRQAVDLRNFVREKSPRSFLLITNTSEIIGRGFRSNV